MRSVLDCAGSPRDMGLDQGEAWRGAIRDRLARTGIASRRPRLATLAPWTSGRVLGAGFGRQLIRHYSHLAERMDAVARGADVSLEALVELFTLASRRGPSADVFSRPALGVFTGRDANPLQLARTLPGLVGSGSSWRLRRSRPEVGFASLELTLPWLVTAAAGLNEKGLGAVVVPRMEPPGSPGADIPTASLLVQECLQRFEALDAALDWCLKRPVTGNGLVLLADEHGESAAVEVAGTRRRVLRPQDGLIVSGAEAQARDRVRKAWNETQDSDAEALDAVLHSQREFGLPIDGVLVLDPKSRSLAVSSSHFDQVSETL
ncbi:MAG: hypothetical protein MJE66_24725 [Proteobacteria bacterium]|nr:hypothetical protein [Pseudomonadota bacterium]